MTLSSPSRIGKVGQRVLEVLGKRLGRFGLALHPDKTRFAAFRRTSLKGHGSSGTFDFLGFTHIWGRSRKGFNVVRQVTAKDRFARAEKSVFDWCKRHRHLPLPDQCEHLAHAIRGHCGYYGLTGNGKRLGGFRYESHPRLAEMAGAPQPLRHADVGTYERDPAHASPVSG